MIALQFLRRLSIHHRPPPDAVASPPMARVMAPRVEVFRGEPRKDRKPRLWYFHRIARNGEITDQSQGYTRKDAAKRGAQRRWPDLPVTVLD